MASRTKSWKIQVWLRARQLEAQSTLNLGSITTIKREFWFVETERPIGQVSRNE